MKNWKKGLALLLALLMLVATLPAAIAADTKVETLDKWAEGEVVSAAELMKAVALVPLEKKSISSGKFSHYTPPEVYALKLSDVLADENIPVGTKIAWSVEGDEYKIGTTDQLVGIQNRWQDNIRCIIGSLKQLDASNVFYDIDLRLSDWNKWLIPTVYAKQEDGTRVPVAVEETNYYSAYYSDGTVMDELSGYVKTGTLESGAEIFVSLSLNPDFAGDRFDSVTLTANGQDVTAQVWNADASVEGNGYPMEFGHWSDESTLSMIMKKDGVVVGESKFELYIGEYGNYVSRSGLFDYDAEGSHIYVVDTTEYEHTDDGSCDVCTLYAGYPANGKYYQKMYYYWNGKESNDRVQMAVVGKYDTVDAAKVAGAVDIKDALFGDKGYQADYSGKGISFSIFADGEVFYESFRTVAGSRDKNSSSNAYFSIEGATDYSYDCYVVDSHDSYYKQGFQTVLVADEAMDLTTVVPEFYIYEGTTAYAGSPAVKQKSGENVLDFSKDPVQYSVSASDGKNVGNYWVTFVKKDTSGPKLFVNAINGPDGAKRELFLNSYAGKYHDIFIANVGNAPLTGLKAELSANAKNVKLDGYWTVGGAGNDTLEAFDTVDKDWDKHGELPNVAKIRVLPDGNGAISGTLTISADGQAPVVITLTGVAGDPVITTTEIPVGVKYVPYGTMIQTTNMYDWNKITFSKIDGSLPAGVELKPNGEIYGVPQETGSFDFTVRMKNSYSSFRSVSAKYTLVVEENTDENVEAQTDVGYSIQTRVPNFNSYADKEFKIEGVLSEFIDLWLDGQKLIRDVDYTAEEGSTKTTILAKTFQNAGAGAHTLAAEFRVNGDVNQDLKKAAQNYTDTSKSTSTKQPSVTSTPTTPTASTPATTAATSLGNIKVGDKVYFTGNGHYYTANSKTPKKAWGCDARVTAIYSTGKHPVHVIGKGVYGWVDLADIGITSAPAPAPAPAAKGDIVKGSKVTINQGAKTYKGGKLASFVYKTTYTVIEVKGDRVVIGLNGVVTAAMNIADLSLAG